MKGSEAANADTLVCLWFRREINHDMFKLWYLAESDLLAEGNAYRLTNTGQGLNRVQQVEHYDILLAGPRESCTVNFYLRVHMEDDTFLSHSHKQSIACHTHLHC